MSLYSPCVANNKLGSCIVGALHQRQQIQPISRCFPYVSVISSFLCCPSQLFRTKLHSTTQDFKQKAFFFPPGSRQHIRLISFLPLHFGIGVLLSGQHISFPKHPHNLCIYMSARCRSLLSFIDLCHI